MGSLTSLRKSFAWVRASWSEYDTATTRSHGQRPRNQAGRATDAQSDFKFRGGMVIIRRRISPWKSGTATHTNNFELGQHGRHRTNVWDYPGVNTMRPGRLEELAMHPTVKPVASVADALKDCSRRGPLAPAPLRATRTISTPADRPGRTPQPP